MTNGCIRVTENREGGFFFPTRLERDINLVHQFQSNGYNIVLDVNSGSVHVVDEAAYDIIALYNQKIVEGKEPDEQALSEIKEAALEKFSHLSLTEEDFNDIISEIEELKENGELFTEDIYEKYVTQFKHRITVVKALCLNVAHDCNLACRYCFAGEGEYQGDRGIMSYEIGKAALDFLIKNSGHRKNLEVDFFGGEPLMNWETVKKLVAYGREQEKIHDKNFRFTITTNGMLLNDEITDFCNKEMTNVVLSIDGRKCTHDYMRPVRGGKRGSYDVIIGKLKKFAKKRGDKEYYVRGTYTRQNLDFAADVIHLADEGFKEVSVEPVVALPDEPYAIREEDIPFLEEQYDILAKEYVKRRREGRGFTFFHFMIDLAGGPCVAKRLSGCGSGTEYVAVTPWGDIYPCHQFVGEEEFVLGNVFDGITKTDLQEGFKHQNVYEKPKCRDCFARYYCSGGCAANSYKFSGNIDDTYDIGCTLQRKRIECAIMIKVAEESDKEEEAEELNKAAV